MKLKYMLPLIAATIACAGLASAKQFSAWPFSAPSVTDYTTVNVDGNGGEIVFDSSNSGFWGHNGSGWIQFGGSGSGNLNVSSMTSAGTITVSDDVVLLSSSSFNATLYAATGNTGKVLTLVHNGTSLSQVYTLLTTGGETIGGVASGSYALYTNGETLKLVSDGSNWAILDHKAETELSSSTGITITINSGTPPSPGTLTTNTMRWKRRGQYAEIFYDFRMTTSGSSGSTGQYLLAIPSNMTMDTSLIRVNTGTGWDGYNAGNVALGVAFSGRGNFQPYDSTHLKLYFHRTDTNASGFWGDTGMLGMGGALAWSGTALVPIAGWQP